MQREYELGVKLAMVDAGLIESGPVIKEATTGGAVAGGLLGAGGGAGLGTLLGQHLGKGEDVEQRRLLALLGGLSGGALGGLGGAALGKGVL